MVAHHWSLQKLRNIYSPTSSAQVARCSRPYLSFLELGTGCVTVDSAILAILLSYSHTSLTIILATRHLPLYVQI